MRLIKDPREIAILRRAGAAIVGVAAQLGPWVRAGRTEREVAADINRGLEQAGFTRPAFETIVASGPNSALPHARPGEHRLADGHLVVLDFGGVLDGYCVDLTRMAGVGRLGTGAVGIFHAVREAHQAALVSIRAGVAAGAVDAAARQVLENKGLGAAFVHGTGHGLGLDVHEAPRLSRLSKPGDLLRAGMVCTIEPGAYVPGVGGARLEDDVLVTDRGVEVLTPASGGGDFHGPLDGLLAAYVAEIEERFAAFRARGCGLRLLRLIGPVFAEQLGDLSQVMKAKHFHAVDHRCFGGIFSRHDEPLCAGVAGADGHRQRTADRP
jgi:hypothetical protein